MPYISKKDRVHIDNELSEFTASRYVVEYCSVTVISSILRSVPSKKIKGAVNYLVTRIVLGAMKPESGWSYSSLSEAVGVLRDAATEIERRLMGPYEDKAIEKNGDIDEYA